MQALILAGGQGTRLRPLTSDVPKPVIRLVDRPFISYMIEWLKTHGVDDVVISCGFLADGVRDVLGDGSQLGVRLRYVDEPVPLGTAGAVKYAEDLLDERFFVLNGDVLTDIDLTAQLKQHLATGAAATLALYPVDETSAYGLVPIKSSGEVEAFLEKTTEPNPPTDLINAGAYVLERSVLDLMEPGVNTSFEREIFPNLVGNGLFGYKGSGYWLDIGTPERYIQASMDIIAGVVKTPVADLLSSQGDGTLTDTVIDSDVVTVQAPATIGVNFKAGAGTVIGSVVIGDNVTLGSNVTLTDTVLFDGVTVGDGVSITSAVVAQGSKIGSGCEISQNVLIGESVEIGAENQLQAGIKVYTNGRITPATLRF